MKEYPELRTERLVLRRFSLLEAAEVRRLAGDPAIADTTLNVPHPYREGMAEQWILTHQAAFEEGDALVLAITLAEKGELVGTIGLTINQRFLRAEVGYWIGKPYWGNGYATESATEVLAYAFEVQRLNRVHATHFARNPASGRVMQKLGMVHEGIARQHVSRGGRYEDLVSYGILRSEWQESRWRTGSGPETGGERS